MGQELPQEPATFPCGQFKEDWQSPALGRPDVAQAPRLGQHGRFGAREDFTPEPECELRSKQRRNQGKSFIKKKDSGRHA